MLERRKVAGGLHHEARVGDAADAMVMSAPRAAAEDDDGEQADDGHVRRRSTIGCIGSYASSSFGLDVD